MDFLNAIPAWIVYPVLIAIALAVFGVFLALIDESDESSGVGKPSYYDDDDDSILRKSEEYEEYMEEMRQDKPPRDNS